MRVVILNILAVICTSSLALALVAGPHKIIGTVKSFDTNTVVIEVEDIKYDVPKEFVTEKNLKVDGKAEVLLSEDQLKKVVIHKSGTKK